MNETFVALNAPFGWKLGSSFERAVRVIYEGECGVVQWSWSPVEGDSWYIEPLDEKDIE